MKQQRLIFFIIFKIIHLAIRTYVPEVRCAYKHEYIYIYIMEMHHIYACKKCVFLF